MIPLTFHDSEPSPIAILYRVPIGHEEAEVIANEKLAMVLAKDRELPKELPTMFFGKGGAVC